MLDWQCLESEDEVIDEVCEGIQRLSRDNMLTVVASVIYHEGMDFMEIGKRIEEMDQRDYLH